MAAAENLFAQALAAAEESKKAEIRTALEAYQREVVAKVHDSEKSMAEVEAARAQASSERELVLEQRNELQERICELM